MKIRAAIVSDYDTTKMKGILEKNGFVLSAKPEFVFTYGGDGTILKAEKKFPGVPMAPVRNGSARKNTPYFFQDLNSAIKTITGKYNITEENKIEAIFRGRRITALNEIQIHTKDPRKALRFSFVSGKKKYNEVIGDGVVIATPYGSTGYYRSIGYARFKRGMFAGFNNVWPKVRPVPVQECKIKIIREQGFVAADNFYLAKVNQGDLISIRKARGKARFVVPKKS